MLRIISTILSSLFPALNLTAGLCYSLWKQWTAGKHDLFSISHETINTTTKSVCLMSKKKTLHRRRILAQQRE